MARSQPFTTRGPRLRAAREEAGVSLDLMAKRTNYGKVALSFYEIGKRHLPVEVIATERKPQPHYTALPASAPTRRSRIPGGLPSGAPPRPPT